MQANKEERKKARKQARRQERKKARIKASKKARQKAGKYEHTIGLLQYIHTPELTTSPSPAQGQDKNAQFWTTYISQSTFQMLGQFSNAVASTIHVVQCTYVPLHWWLLSAVCRGGALRSQRRATGEGGR